MARKLTAKQEAKRIDREIDAAFYRRCANVQINILDIPKVFAAGRAAAVAGQDIEAAVVAAVATLQIQ